MRGLKNWLVDTPLLLKLSLTLQFGRWFWLVPVIALLWPAYNALALVAGWRVTGFEPAHAQNYLIGLPLYLLAIGLGVRIIAGEIEARTLEVTYTVPGGAQRVWISKMIAALLPLIAAEILLAVFCMAFFTAFPLSALYGTLQGIVVYLALAMGLGALTRSEITATLLAAIVLFFNGMLTGFGDNQIRWSPFFNPLAVPEQNQAQVFGWLLQNRIGMALVVMALVALSCVRAERREELLRM
jgi:ABC-type transport system involved in multi-copper enzyme maturation permease subunit